MAPSIWTDIQDALLNLLFSIFKIKLPTWKDAFLDGKRLTGVFCLVAASFRLTTDN
jgi:hypothetical protein